MSSMCPVFRQYFSSSICLSERTLAPAIPAKGKLYVGEDCLHLALRSFIMGSYRFLIKQSSPRTNTITLLECALISPSFVCDILQFTIAEVRSLAE